MISFREYCQLDEAFTDPLPIKVTMRPQAWTASFTVPASPDDPRGRWADKDYEVSFARSPPRSTALTIPKELKTSNVAWELTFQSDDPDDSFGVTGGGQAFTVFATVIHALKMFVQKTRPHPFIFFTAKISLNCLVKLLISIVTTLIYSTLSLTYHLLHDQFLY